MSGSAPKACVIGHPIAHSISPILHGGWLRDCGIAGAYEAWDVTPDQLGHAIGRLRTEGYRGANITIPHKEAVCQFVDEVEDNARIIGAVNTLVIDRGRIVASNTDAFGYVEHLSAELPGWRAGLKGRPVLVLGAGGAARGVIYGLAQAGAVQFILINRTRERAERLAADMSAAVKVDVEDWSYRERAAAEAGLIINATPLGLKGGGALQMDLSGVQDAIVSDLVYSPVDTPLLNAARMRGLATLDGLGMLINQGRPGFMAWFGTNPPAGPAVRARLLAALAAG